MTFHRWELLVAIFLAFTSSSSAANDAFQAESFERLTAELEAKGKPTGLPPFDVETGTFIEPPPTGFTTEGYRAAFRQLVLDDVDRRSRDDHFKGLDQNMVRQQLLEDMQRAARPGDSITEAAIEALWYIRTPPEEIPESAPAPPTSTQFDSTSNSGLFLHAFFLTVFAALAAIQSPNQPGANAKVIAGVVLLLLFPAAIARGAPVPQAEAIARHEAADRCESHRDVERGYLAWCRRTELHFIDVRRDNAIRYCQEVAGNHTNYVNDIRGIAWKFHAIHSAIAIAVCTYFCRSRGVTMLQRQICVAFLLAFIAHGLYEAHTVHAANLAALRETERAGIEAATRTADEARLEARWQYDRQIAVADILFEQCQAAAAATPEAFSE
jgi:hypothetical protein